MENIEQYSAWMMKTSQALITPHSDSARNDAIMNARKNHYPFKRVRKIFRIRLTMTSSLWVHTLICYSVYLKIGSTMTEKKSYYSAGFILSATFYHFITYFIMGILASSILDYKNVFLQPIINDYY